LSWLYDDPFGENEDQWPLGHRPDDHPGLSDTTVPTNNAGGLCLITIRRRCWRMPQLGRYGASERSMYLISCGLSIIE
jgi:hypothetical protein